MQRDCLIHANCQGDPLAEILRAHPSFGADFTVTTFTNYTREPAPPSIETCDLFLYQPLGPFWGEVSNEALLPRLSSSCRSFCIPSLLHKGYWPFWKSDPNRQYKDVLLDELLDRGLSDMEVMHLYLKSDITRIGDPAGLVHHALAMARQREVLWDVDIIDDMVDLCRTTWAFNTINHPNRELMLLMADRILEGLGYAGCPAELRKAFADPYPEFQLPIHPQVAAMEGLEFLEKDQLFHVYGTEMTFERYVWWYIRHRRLEEEVDFIDFLRVVAAKEGA